MQEIYQRTRSILDRIMELKAETPTATQARELEALRAELLELCPADRFGWVQGKPAVDLIEIFYQNELEREKSLNKYSKLGNQIKGLKSQIGKLSDRISETESNAEKNKDRRSILVDARRQALIDGNAGKAKEIEGDIRDLDRESEMAALSLEAIAEKIETLKTEISAVEAERMAVFLDLASGWIREEAQKYDEAAKAAIEAGKRLQASARILLESDRLDVYWSAVGPKFQALPAARIPILTEPEKYKLSMTGHCFRSGNETRDEVLNEIIKTK